MVNVPALETDATAFADVAGGDDATIATASNGRQTPSMQKVLKDQIRWKAPILWTVSVNVTDILQPYTSPIDGFAYAAAPGKVPFISATDPSTDAVNWFLVQGYAQGSGADLDLNATGSITDGLNGTFSGKVLVGTGAPLGTEILGIAGQVHFKNSGGSGLTAPLDADDVVLDSSSGARLSMLSPVTKSSRVNFANPTSLFHSWLDVDDTGRMEFRAVGGTRLTFNSASAVFNNDILPSTTEVSDLGSPSFEFDNLFVQNSPTVSDERTKHDLGSASTLIPMLRLIDPRMYSRKEKIVRLAEPERIESRQKTEMVTEDYAVIEIINGVPVQSVVSREIQKPVFKLMTIKDQNGVSLKDKKGKVRKHPAPIMENVTVPAVPETVVTHGRPHAGMMAQAVKQAMTDTGVDDFAGYAYHDAEDLHVLRLTEFIGPMLAYIQSLEKRIEKLEE